MLHVLIEAVDQILKWMKTTWRNDLDANPDQRSVSKNIFRNWSQPLVVYFSQMSLNILRLLEWNQTQREKKRKTRVP